MTSDPTLKNHIIMVNVPYSEYWSYEDAGDFYPGLGIMLIATQLKNAGFEIDIVDGAYYPDYHERVLQLVNDKTLFVGFSLMTSQLRYGYDLSKKLKENFPKLNIVWGGTHPSLFHGMIVQSPYVDYAIRNEFVEKVVEFATSLQEGKPPHMPGVAFVDSDGKTYAYDNHHLDDMRNVPFIDYSLLNLDNYMESWETKNIFPKGTPWKYFIITTGLGCVYQCTFCENTLLKRKYRTRDAETILDRIEYLQKTYGANAFCFRDEDFFIDKKRLNRFVDLVKERGLKFKWHSQASIVHYKDSYINKEMGKKLADSGCVFMNHGGESLNERVLNEIIAKPYKLNQVDYCIDVESQSNIKSWFSFMVGMPGEKYEEMMDTFNGMIQIQKKLPYEGAVRVFSFRLYPGSPLSDKILKETSFTYPESLEKWLEKDQEQGFLSIDDFAENPERIKLLLEFFNTFNKKSFGSFLKKAVHTLTLKPLIYLRFKHRFFSFPFEIKMIQKLKGVKTRPVAYPNADNIRRDESEPKILKPILETTPLATELKEQDFKMRRRVNFPDQQHARYIPN